MIKNSTLFSFAPKIFENPTKMMAKSDKEQLSEHVEAIFKGNLSNNKCHYQTA